MRLSFSDGTYTGKTQLLNAKGDGVPLTPFTRVLVAQTASSLGNGLHAVAFPLLATTFTTDPLTIAALAVMSNAPAVFLAMPVGVWVDRSHRGRLMAASDALCAVLLLGLCLLLALGVLQLWMLFLVAGLVGVAELVFGTSLYALVPSIVGRNDLIRANSRLAVVTEAGAGGIGPALGGTLFGLSKALPFALNAVSYLVSSLAVASFAAKGDTRARSDTQDTKRPRLWSELGAGLSFARKNRAARTTILLSAGSGLFGWMPEGTLVLFATQELGASEWQFGLIMAITTVGAVIGGIITPRLTRRFGLTTMIAVTFVGYGVLLIPVAFADSVWLVATIFLLQGLPLVACSTAIGTAQQMLVPSELLGRFGALKRLVNAVVVPVGLSAGGLLGAALGLRWVWVIAGAGFVVMFLANIPALRNLGEHVREQSDTESVTID